MSLEPNSINATVSVLQVFDQGIYSVRLCFRVTGVGLEFLIVVEELLSRGLVLGCVLEGFADVIVDDAPWRGLEGAGSGTLSVGNRFVINVLDEWVVSDCSHR